MKIRNVANMARVVRHCLRNPWGSYKAVQRSMGAEEAIAFAGQFPTTSSTPGAEVAPFPDPAINGTANPLWDHVQALKTGPGILKWTHYLPMYHRHLARFRNRPVHIVEIGIYSGGSLGMWREYFGAECHVSGIDIEESCRSYANEKITVYIGDQQDRSFWRKFRQEAPPIDILIDDGGHTPEQQRITLEEMLPHIKPGGVFLCEDIHGTDNEFTAYAHRLASRLNYPDIDDLQNRQGEIYAATTPFQQVIASAHFYPFAVAFERTMQPFHEFYSPARGTEWQPFLGKRG